MADKMTDRDNPKTVADLISDLQKYPQDMRVMTRGYEGGYYDAAKPSEINIALNIHTEWYYGPHDEPYSDRDKQKPIIKAILI